MSEDTGSVDTGNPPAEGGGDTIQAPDATTSAPWIDSIENAETRAWAENKGLHKGNFENVVTSYHNLEKLFGADKAGRTVTLLGDDASPEDVSAFYSKLGRPKEAKDYGLVAPEGGDNSFADWASNTFFEAGLTSKQAALLASKWEDFRAQAVQQQSDADVVSANEAEATLRKEWGAAYDTKVSGINAAAEKLGITTDQLEGLRSAMGPVEAMRFVDGLNTKMGDHDFDEGGENVTGVLTPEQATQAMNELQMNREFMDAWLDKSHPGHKAAVEKKTRLSKLAAGIAA